MKNIIAITVSALLAMSAGLVNAQDASVVNPLPLPPLPVNTTTSAPAAAETTAPSVVPQASATVDSNIQFPEIKKAWIQEGDFVNTENLRKVAPGLSKDQLYKLIGRPHFSEGIFGVKTWNYIFNFRTGAGPEYVTCQYQIKFDKQKLAESMYWKDPGCAKFVEEPVAQKTVEIRTEPAPPVSIPSIQRFDIAGDVLFNFNKYQLSDLRNQGRTELDKVANIIKSYKSIDVIRVIGHTDPLASTEYNFGLSYKRALAVKNYLVRTSGLNPKMIQVRGAGETELVKTLEDCNSNQSKGKKGKKSKAVSSSARGVQECLLPNRRAEIEVIGVKN
jgi:OmpA-OmpF porin, OOP family